MRRVLLFVLSSTLLLFYSPALHPVSSEDQGTCTGVCVSTCCETVLGSGPPLCTGVNSICCSSGTCTAPTSTPIPFPTSYPTLAPTIVPQFTPLTIPCSVTLPSVYQFGGLLEFHPLRPYPANPCDPLIPVKIPQATATENKLYVTYNCSKSANPEALYGPVEEVVDISTIEDRRGWTDWTQLFNLYFPEANLGPDYRSRDFICPDSTDVISICFLKRIDLDIALDYSPSQFPVLGNTQNLLSDAAKVNEYLDWYLNGTVFQSEQKSIGWTNPSEAEQNRVINYSGPLNKLLSRYSRARLAETLYKNASGPDYHNYQVSSWTFNPTYGYFTGDPRTYSSLHIASGVTVPIYFPYSSLEDTVGEVQPAIIPGQQPTNIDGFIYTGVMPPSYLNCGSTDPLVLCIGGADSRLYFPHLRNTNAMADIIASINRPHPTVIPTPDPTNSSIDTTNPQTVKQTIPVHQGTDPPVPGGADSTVVQIAREYPGSTQITRNTEVREGALAPLPLYVPSDPLCDQIRVRTGPGDKLFGKTINTNLTYFQFFRYTPQLVLANDCTGLSSCKIKGSCVEELGKCSCACVGYTGCGGIINPTGPGDCPAGCEWQCSGGVQSALNTSGCCWNECPPPPQPIISCTSSGGSCNGVNGVCPTGYHPFTGDCIGYPVEVSCCASDSCVGSCTTIDTCPSAIFDDKAIDCTAYGYYCCIDQVSSTSPVYCPAWPEKNLRTAARVSIFTKTPIIERIYRILVSGTQSVLRRFLPGRFGDIPASAEYIRGETNYTAPNDNTVPASTNANYSAAADPSNAVGLSAVGITAGRGGAPAIYFPKAGSLYDYFLGGSGVYPNLQCSLRPYGSCRLYTPTAGSVTDGINCHLLASPSVDPASVGLCGIDSYVAAATAWTAGGGKNYALECYNDVIDHALSMGVSPKFLLWVWLHESAASNYTYFGPTLQDFGMPASYSPPTNFEEQIAAFATRIAETQSTCGTTLEDFIAMWFPGHCDPTLVETFLYNGVLTTHTIEEWVDIYIAEMAKTWDLVACDGSAPSL